MIGVEILKRYGIIKRGVHNSDEGLSILKR